MKKKFLFLLVSIIFASVFFSSCQKEQITTDETEVVNDIVKNIANSANLVANGYEHSCKNIIYNGSPTIAYCHHSAM